MAAGWQPLWYAIQLYEQHPYWSSIYYRFKWEMSTFSFIGDEKRNVGWRNSTSSLLIPYHFFLQDFFRLLKTAKTNLFNECLTTLRVRQRNPSWVAALIWRCVSMVHYARTDPGRLEWKDKSLIRTGTWNEWCRATAATAKFRIIIELCAARTEEINRKKKNPSKEVIGIVKQRIDRDSAFKGKNVPFNRIGTRMPSILYTNRGGVQKSPENTTAATRIASLQSGTNP